VDIAVLATQLAACHPLAQKLAGQQYAYRFDPTDLSVWPTYDHVVAQLPGPDEEGALEQVEALFHQAHFTDTERIWLDLWYKQAPFFQQLMSGEVPYEGDLNAYYPFAQRLTEVGNLIQRLLHLQVIRLHDLDWLSLADMAREYAAVLPLAETLLVNRLTQAFGGDEDAMLPLSPSAQALLEFMHAQRDRLGLESLLPPDPRLPSTERKDPWIRATISAWVPTSLPLSEQPTRSGRWIVQIPREQVDALWQRIVQATREGRLGKKARVSTLRPPKKHLPPRPDHRIEISTFDAQDEQEAQRVKQALLDLGITQPLSYSRQ
jgi:hypothetical protein